MIKYGLRQYAILILAILTLSGFLSACKDTSKAESPPVLPAQMSEPREQPLAESRYVVGVAWQGMTPYVQRLETQLLTFSANLPYEIEFLMMDGSENYEKQISQVENLISQKVDLILLNPCSYGKLAPAVTAAQSAGIPVVTVITRVQNQSQCTSFVGSDHKESAILEGRMAAEQLGGKGNIVILQGTMGIEAQLSRSEGYREILAEYPGLEVVAMQPAFWEKDEGYIIIENLIHNGVKIDAVLSQNDNMALGAIEALEDAGLQEETLVFGIDGDSPAIEAVKAGRLAGTVYMDAHNQAKQIIECIGMIHDGKEPADEYLVPFIVLDDQSVHDESTRTLLVY